MIIKNKNKFDTVIKQEPLDRVHYKGITASLYFTHERLEIIQYKIPKGANFFLTPDESNPLPEVIYVLSGVIRKDPAYIQESQTFLYQAGEFISFVPVTKPIMLTSESEESELLYIYPSQVFQHLVAAAANELHNMVTSMELKMGIDLDRFHRIRKHAVKLGKVMNLNEYQLFLIPYACQFYNLGKVMYTDELLNSKQSQLSENDHWKRHPVYAKELLQETEQSDFIKTGIIVEQCYEYWDGTGYPYGLKGEEISIEASIISVSFHFENALEKYQSEDLALEEIKQGSGTLFRPDVVIALSEILKK